MLKKHMAACLVASAFITMPVLAQTSTSPGTTSPGASQPATGASSGSMGVGSGAAASGSASGRFITNQQQNQWRASRLIGLTVYGSNNERIGDINEVLVDRSGKADAVVLGVGGFLGIGEKNVALPFDAFEWQMEERRTTTAGGTGGAGTGADRPATGTTASTGAAGTSSPAAGTPAARDTAATGSTTAAGGSAARTDAGGSGARSSSAERGYPDHAVLRMTKADLENAPTFRYVGDNRSDDRSGSGANRSTGGGSGMGSGSGAGTGVGSPGTTAPRQ